MPCRPARHEGHAEVDGEGNHTRLGRGVQTLSRLPCSAPDAMADGLARRGRGQDGETAMGEAKRDGDDPCRVMRRGPGDQ